MCTANRLAGGLTSCALGLQLEKPHGDKTDTHVGQFRHALDSA